MKLTKKKVFVAALAVCLVAILSMGTLAWFNDADEITNQFLTADSDGDGTSEFKVDVFETDNENDNEKTQDGNVYENIAPGSVLKKDPQVANLGDYDQWIRAYVTFDEWSVIEAACNNQGISTDLRVWLSIDTGVWTPVDAETVIDEQADTITYVYYLNAKLLPGTTEKLFKEVAIPGEFEIEDMQFADKDFNITIKAEALQADNTGDNAQKAFALYWGK